VRMATLAPVLDADELARAVKALSGAPSASGGGPASGPRGTVSSQSEPVAAPARRLKVEGEVKADAPRRSAARGESRRQSTDDTEPVVDASASESARTAADLPELRAYIRQKKAALAGFMELGAGLELTDDVLRVLPRSDIYVRYLNDNKGAISALAAEHYRRPIKVELAQPLTGDAPVSPAEAEVAQKAIPAATQPTAAQPVDLQTTTEAAAQTNSVDANGEPIDRDAVRKELFADPLVRKILDELEGRLVDVRRPAARRNQGGQQ